MPCVCVCVFAVRPFSAPEVVVVVVGLSGTAIRLNAAEGKVEDDYDDYKRDSAVLL